MSDSFQRARRPSQKAIRRTAILVAAGELLETETYDTISLKAVAARAEVGKASLYTYFRTKEEIFLELYHQDLEDWLQEVVTRLDDVALGDTDALTNVLVDCALGRPRACRLSALLESVLERNVPADVLLTFKREVLSQSARLMAALHRVFPRATPELLLSFLVGHFALISGLWPMANPPDRVRSILDTAPELAALAVEMRPSLERGLRWMAVGLAAEI